MIEKSYGKNPQEGWSFYDASNRIDKVKRYHEMIHKDEESNGVIDDITWNDLEMDNVFLRINHANSFIGEQFLYHRLHYMNYMSDDSRRKDFERKLAYYGENPEVRLSVENKLQYIDVLSESFKQMPFWLYFHETASIFSSYTPCTHCENIIVS